MSGNDQPIAAATLRDTIVKPALEAIGLWSAEAEQLVMGTAAQESNLRFVRQFGNGPGRGYFQMEPATHDDCYANYLNFPAQAALKAKVLALRTAGGEPDADELITNHRYAAAMCRVKYRRAPGAIPTDGHGIAQYWKQHYNTLLGAGTVAQFVQNWNHFLTPAPYARID